MSIALPLVGVLLLIAILSGVRILQEFERGVLFRLGSCLKEVRGPGLTLILPFGIDRLTKVDLRVITFDVPSQDVITRDNVSVKVNAVVYFQVVDARRAILEVENYLFASSQLAQTTLRSVCGQQDMDTLLIDRERLNSTIQTILDRHTDPWGVKVTLVEIKQIDLPQEMQRAMAKQAEAERERRAKVIHAEGEEQAARKLVEAAKLMEPHPVTVQLRYLQTLTEIASENNSTTIFPLPIEWMSVFMPKK
ncbi:MAG: slipin family protein [Deltaproteobacteria bacterium]|nr:slipin family protein [Deltaproteobacteria bacterium]